MFQPEPQSNGLSSLLYDVENGVIKIPQFEREFVWEKKVAAQLLESGRLFQKLFFLGSLFRASCPMMV